MDLGFTSEEEAFRNEVRTWLDRNLPTEWRHRGVGGFREDDDTDLQRQWQSTLHEGGWLKLAWPLEAGGRAATPVMQAIYQEEMAKAGAPIILGRLGVGLLAPTLLVHGSDWQKKAYVDKILSGEIIFCQGFSEPDAGSDLAGLRTRAEKRDGKWVLAFHVGRFARRFRLLRGFRFYRAQVHPRCRRDPLHFQRAARRASQQLALFLGGEIVRRAEPAFEPVTNRAK